MRKLIDYLQSASIIILILFGIFLAYQIIKKIFGGSWSSEDIIIALLVFNMGFTFTIAVTLAKLNSDHQHLQKQFYCLARDFKEHLSDK